MLTDVAHQLSKRRSETSGTSRAIESSVAAVALVALGFRQFIGPGVLSAVTSGFLFAVALIPLWVGALKLFWGARFLFSVGLLALLSGVVLTEFEKGNRTISPGIGVNSAALLVGTLSGIGVILWTRKILKTSIIGLLYGIGMIGNAILGPDRSSVNAWKFVWAIPVAVIALSLVHIGRKKWIEVAALLILALLSVQFDSRSYFATFLLAALFLLWQARPQVTSSRASWGATASYIAILGLMVYYLGSTLLVDGYLGEQAQQRSTQQIEAAGSLILGGRPELAAFFALLQNRPFGFGLSVQPTLYDVNVAKTGMASVGYDPNNGYVENFMFGGHVELHSVAGDMWASYGIPGLFMVFVFGFLIVRTLALSISSRSASAIVAFLSCWSLWNLFFSPLYSAAPTLMLTIGLCMTKPEPKSIKAVPDVPSGSAS